MKITVAGIPDEGAHYTGSTPGSILQVEKDPFIRKPGEIHYALHARRISKKLAVCGSIDVSLELQCTRCCVFFSTTIVISDFLRAYSLSKGCNSVDVTEDLREESLLHIPGFPVCDQACRGLCSQCGADLNKESCGCGNEEVSNSWYKLEELNFNMFKESENGSSKKKNF